MSELPGRQVLVDALEDAAATHHEYEVETLGGERDELWAGFYAAFVLGRLGEFARCSEVVSVLASAAGEPWAERAADALLDRLR